MVHLSTIQLNQTLISRFRQARENLINLLDQQATFLRLDLEARQYVIPCLRRQIPQYIDILVTMSIMISNRSRHHPYVLFRRNLYGVVIPMQCEALKAQCTLLSNRLRDNNCTDIPETIASQIDSIIANLPF